MLTTKQKQTLHKMGSAEFMVKMAEYDGYHTQSNEDVSKRLMSVLGQKYFTKKASLKRAVMGINAYKKIKK